MNHSRNHSDHEPTIQALYLSWSSRSSSSFALVVVESTSEKYFAHQWKTFNYQFYHNANSFLSESVGKWTSIISSKECSCTKAINPTKQRLKRHHWNKITVFRIMTDRKLTTELEILHAKLITRNPSWKDMDFYSSFPGLQHLTKPEVQNISFNHSYGRGGYQLISSEYLFRRKKASIL